MMYDVLQSFLEAPADVFKQLLDADGRCASKTTARRF
jgi:hypothetical protein